MKFESFSLPIKRKVLNVRAVATEFNVVKISQKVWYRTGSDVSKKVEPTLRTKQSLGDILLWKSCPCWRQMNNGRAQAFVHCQ